MSPRPAAVTSGPCLGRPQGEGTHGFVGLLLCDIVTHDVTICREWYLHRESAAGAQAKPLLCRSWQCPHCQPLRRRQLMANAAAGDPVLFLTLTVNPRLYAHPEERLKKLAWAWRTVVKRLRRERGHDSIEYLAIVEATKRGEPHLHILLRAKFIAQSYLSQCMNELIESPIVDIRRVRSALEVVRYVAKYITKKPAQFGTSKRYWQSRNYARSESPSDPDAPADIGKYIVWTYGLKALLTSWLDMGFNTEARDDDKWVGFPIEPWRWKECQTPIKRISPSAYTIGRPTNSYISPLTTYGAWSHIPDAGEDILR